jgi:transposase
MAKFKVAPEPGSQRVLWPRSLDEAVADSPEVRLVSEIIDRLDFSQLEASYAEVGCRAYPPRMMTKVLVYAYLKGIRSSRQIADMVGHDDRMRWLAGGLEPDFHTIARFRKEKLGELSDLFQQSIRLCQEIGLVRMHQVAVDGTKVRADASRQSLYDEKRLQRERKRVARILAEAEAVDAEEDALYGEESGEVSPEALGEARARQEKLDEIDRQLKESGRKQVSTSDPDSRMMKTTRGVLPSYNVQAAVDAEHQVIVAAYVTQSEHDHGQLPVMLAEVEENTGARADVVLADSGYSDQPTYEALAARGQEALIPPPEQGGSRRREDGYGAESFRYDEDKDSYACPLGGELTRRRDMTHYGRGYIEYAGVGCRECGARGECIRTRHHRERRLWRPVTARTRERMRERLETPEGREAYAVRGRTVEPVFGQMKGNRRFDRLMLRGLAGAQSEVALICLVHNVMKCVRQRMHSFCALLGAGGGLWRAIRGRKGIMGAVFDLNLAVLGRSSTSPQWAF